MMDKKSILLIDTPKSCKDCPFLLIRPTLNCGEYDWNNIYNEVKFVCPLKPLPEKKELKEMKHLKDFVDIETQYDYITNKIVGKINYDVETIFNDGYNSCIDEILKEGSE